MIICEVNKKSGKIGAAAIENWVKNIFKALKIKNAAVSVAVVGNEEIRKLNKKYRKKDKPTDVLSFREEESADFFFDTDKKYLGEVIISHPEAVREAREDRESERATMKKLLAHGILHLLGYDHEKSVIAAKKMFKLQDEVLDKVKNK